MTVSLKEFSKNPKIHLRDGSFKLTHKGNLIAQVQRISDFAEVEAGARTLLVSGMGPNTKGLIKLVSMQDIQSNASALVGELAFDKTHSLVIMERGKPKFVIFCYVGRVESVILDHADAMGRPHTLDPEHSAESVEQGLKAISG